MRNFSAGLIKIDRPESFQIRNNFFQLIDQKDLQPIRCLEATRCLSQTSFALGVVGSSNMSDNTAKDG